MHFCVNAVHRYFRSCYRLQIMGHIHSFSPYVMGGSEFVLPCVVFCEKQNMYAGLRHLKLLSSVYISSLYRALAFKRYYIY